MNFKEEIQKDANEGLNVHDHLKDHTVDELRAICDNDRSPFAVCALNVTGDINVSTMLRTACLFGAENFFIIGRRRYDKRGTVGAQNYIPVHRIAALNDDLTIDRDTFVNTMCSHGYTPIFVEQDGHNVHDVDWPTMVGPYSPCLVVGNENRGIDENILDSHREFKNSFTVSIPQKGVLRSHNVGVSAGIIMSHMVSSMGW